LFQDTIFFALKRTTDETQPTAFNQHTTNHHFTYSNRESEISLNDLTEYAV